MDEEALQRVARLAELGMLSATLAHEQRQPLFAIKSIAQLLERRVGADDQVMLAKLLEQVEHLERLIDGVGRFARSPSGELQPVDLAGLAEGAAALMVHRAKRRQVALRVAPEPQLPAAKANGTAVTQILVNLLQNAIDVSPPNAEVLLRSFASETQLFVEVVDHGPGLSAESADQVFEPFFTTKQEGQGTGLGLTISRQLAESCGGTLALLPGAPGLIARLTLQRWS